MTNWAPDAGPGRSNAYRRPRGAPRTGGPLRLRAPRVDSRLRIREVWSRSSCG